MAIKSLQPKRGEVYLVDFDPSKGAEIQKQRPALIIQNDIANTHSAVTIVVALTSHDDGKVYPTEVLVKKGEAGLDRNSRIVLSQIRTIDKSRLSTKLGEIKVSTLEKVEFALKLSVGLIDLA